MTVPVEEDQAGYEGRKRYYTDPLRGGLPELERCLIRHRALQMILIIYHAEELKRDVINGVAAQLRWRAAVADTDAATPEEVIQENKKLKRAFAHLVQDGALTADQQRHMVKLIEKRNSIAPPSRSGDRRPADRSVRPRLAGIYARSAKPRL